MPEQEPQVGQAERSTRHVFIGDGAVGGFHHGVHQVQLADVVAPLHLARFHRAAGNKNHRNVQAHGGHQHAGGDLVAVGDAHQRVGTVGIHHVFHAVGDQVAAGQAVQHAAVAHGDAVVDGDGVEFLGHAASAFDFARHQLAHIVQVDMAGHELGEAVGNGDDGLAKILVFHAGGAPQGAGTRHVAAGGGGFGTVLGHVLFP
jgi:hypothetical protein